MQITLVKIGNEVVDVSHPGCRPVRQHAAVLAWHSEHPATRWVCNPFATEPDGRVFACSFVHAYYTPAGELAAIRVTPTGRITRYVGSCNNRMLFN